VKDGFARYTFDQARARALLSQSGWNPGGDGVAVGPNGQRFTTSLWTTEGGDTEISVIADYWKQIGVSAEQYVVAGAIVRNREARTKYPGFETSARGYGDSLLSRVDSRVAAVPSNQYSGANRGGYKEQRMDDLIDRYRQSVNTQQLGNAAKAISDFMVEELPLLPLYFNPTTPAVRQGLRALDDFRGGSEASRLYGTFSRNAHEWDVD
jgi:peptide/nickel transport system substrate-binding protein